MNRKNLGYAAFALIIVAVLLFVFTGEWARLTGRQADFAIPDTSLVSRIQISGTDTVNLLRAADGWEVNGRYKADPTAVNNFLFAFSRLSINGMMKTTDLENRRARSIRIWVGKRVKRLRFYPSPEMPLMHHTGSGNVYRVGVFGFPKADLSQIINDHVAYWKNKVLISLKPDEIRRVVVSPAEKWGRGFIIERKAGRLILEDEQGNIIPDSLYRS